MPSPLCSLSRHMAAVSCMGSAATIGIPVNIVVATTPSGGIGKDGKLPWSLKGDMQNFTKVTKTVHQTNKMNAVIMGRKTWASIPRGFSPLVGRKNIVVSSTLERETLPSEVSVVKSVEEAIQFVQKSMFDQIEQIFVIGGSRIYAAALETGLVHRIYRTRIGIDYETDVFFPEMPDDYQLVSLSPTHSTGTTPYDFAVYERNSPSSSSVDTSSTTKEEPSIPSSVISSGHEEYQYLDLVSDMIKTGRRQDDRTKVGILSKFGCQMRFNLRESFPLLTTKRVFWRGVVEELLWFIRGDTNGNHLAEKGVKIWEKNGTREFLDSRGLVDREVDDLGPIYGFQWRHFGAKYKDMHSDYTGQGVDQLAECIAKIKNDPTDRRIVLSAWNPADLPKMALPPCHMCCQFYVDNGELSCLMFQRSCDIGLGVPFNIASYALLTCMIAHVCNLKPGEFVHSMGNAHVYVNHVEALKEQISRDPRPFPFLKLNPNVKDIDDFKASDIELFGYQPHKPIQMEMAV